MSHLLESGKGDRSLTPTRGKKRGERQIRGPTIYIDNPESRERHVDALRKVLEEITATYWKNKDDPNRLRKEYEPLAARMFDILPGGRGAIAINSVDFRFADQLKTNDFVFDRPDFPSHEPANLSTIDAWRNFVRPLLAKRDNFFNRYNEEGYPYAPKPRQIEAPPKLLTG